MEGNCPMHNNITTIVAHPTPGRSKRKCYSTRIFGSSISVQQTDDTYTCPQGEILKPRKMAQEKVELSKAVISSRNTEQSACKLSSKPFMHQ
jgi:hypothetical protein